MYEIFVEENNQLKFVDSSLTKTGIFLCIASAKLKYPNKDLYIKESNKIIYYEPHNPQ